MARLLIDANLSHVVADILSRAGHDAVHVRDLGLLAASDATILDRAIADRRIIVSFDLDFVHLLAASASIQPSLILIRTRSAQRAVIMPRLIAALLAEATALERGAIVVIDERNIRVRPLPVGLGP